MESRVTFCSLCEALCGLTATVEGGRLVQVRADREHPVSKGFACQKGIALPQLLNDPDRVTAPLRRRGDGSFEAVSWDDALDDIGDRLRRIVDTHGGRAVGAVLGNPTAYDYAATFWAKGLVTALGSPHLYASASTDVNNYWAASALLYGHPMANPIPDLDRTEFLVIVGANPLVSHGSMVTAPRIAERLRAIVRRGGRVVVFDPRRSETARAFEHVPIRANEDAWLLLSLLQVILSEGLADVEAIARTASGAEFLERLAAPYSPDATETRTGVPAEHVREIARAFAHAPRAVAYGRTGPSLGSSGTLVTYLIDALNVVTGNFDREGGAVFGRPLIDLAELSAQFGQATYGTWRTRVDGLPELLGTSPTASIAREITTAGPGQLRALIVVSGNPCRSAPRSEAMEVAMDALDLLVTIDLYVSDTGRHADYVLPGTTSLERDAYPWFFSPLALRPYAQWSPKVVDAPGECREEWWILDQIARRIGVVPSASRAARVLGRLGFRLTPAAMFDLLLRIGREGDLFGLRPRGWSRRKLWARPRGAPLADTCPTGVARKNIRHRDRRVHLEHESIRHEVERLATAHVHDYDYPLRLISQRDMRSLNTWLLNVPDLVEGRTQRLKIHPSDARVAGLEDGELALITSRSGAVEVAVEFTVDMTPGNVALPQGWGHVASSGWRRAVAAGGANYNILTSDAAADQDPLSGNAWLNGIPVRVSRRDVLRTFA